jgi:hypothetical protein
VIILPIDDSLGQLELGVSLGDGAPEESTWTLILQEVGDTCSDSAPGKLNVLGGRKPALICRERM